MLSTLLVAPKKEKCNEKTLEMTHNKGGPHSLNALSGFQNLPGMKRVNVNVSFATFNEKIIRQSLQLLLTK